MANNMIAEELKRKEEQKKNNNDNFFALILAHIQYYKLLENVLNYLYQKLLTENNLLGTEVTEAKQELSSTESVKTTEVETSAANSNLVKKSQQLSQEVDHLVSELIKTLDHMIKEVINTFPVSLSLEVSEKLTPTQQHYFAELIPSMISTNAVKSSDTEVAAKQSQSTQTQEEISHAVSKAQAVQGELTKNHQQQLAQLAESAKKVNQQITLIKMITLEHQVQIVEPLLVKLQILGMLSESFFGMQTRISPMLTNNHMMTHTVELFVGMREAMLGLNKTLGYVDAYRDLKNTQQSNNFIPKQYRY